MINRYLIKAYYIDGGFSLEEAERLTKELIVDHLDIAIDLSYFLEKSCLEKGINYRQLKLFEGDFYDEDENS